ncbi:hypothetical protein COOONC_03664 [Cooperia oncophora]
MTENLVHDWRRFLNMRMSTHFSEALLVHIALQHTLLQGQKERPFFFYFSFPQVHSAQFANADFRGSSVRGIYGDSINEMSWAVGEVLNSLVKAGIAENTLVVLMRKIKFVRKGRLFRIPFIAWQPGTVKAGRVSNEVISSMDLYATFREMQTCPFRIHYRTSPIFFNDTMDPNLPYFCPMGNLERTGTSHRHALTSSLFCTILLWSLISLKILMNDLHSRKATMCCGALGAQLLREHRESLIPVPNQLGHFNKQLTPCCNPPSCQCDKISYRRNENARDALFDQEQLQSDFLESL